LKAVSTIRHARESGHPGSKLFMEVIWIPVSTGMTKDAIHPRFKKRGILAYFRKNAIIEGLQNFQMGRTGMKKKRPTITMIIFLNSTDSLQP